MARNVLEKNVEVMKENVEILIKSVENETNLVSEIQNLFKNCPFYRKPCCYPSCTFQLRPAVDEWIRKRTRMTSIFTGINHSTNEPLG